MSLGQARRRAARYAQIACILARHGLDYLRTAPGRRRGGGDRAARGERLRQLFTDLGPGFIKLGQLLSLRSDVIPADIADALASLQDRVQPAPADLIRRRVAQELDRPLTEAFSFFSEEPLAVASLAQVHKAFLPGGQAVAVKVLRPGAEEMIRQDLDVFVQLARWVGRLCRRRRPDGAGSRLWAETLDELRALVLQELDYTWELQALQEFRRNFRGWRSVHIPRAYPELCTAHVLTLEYIEGVPLHRFPLDHGPAPRRILQVAARAFFKQVFLDGCFHADPHPGNLLVEADGRLALVDFGQVGRLEPEMLWALGRAFRALAAMDVRRLEQALVRMGALEEGQDTPERRRGLQHLMGQAMTRPLGQIAVGSMWQELQGMMGRFSLRLPRELVSLVKALITLEGVCKGLDPDFALLPLAKPFARELSRRQLQPQAVARRWQEHAAGYIQKVVELPLRLDRVLGQLERVLAAQLPVPDGAEVSPGHRGPAGRRTGSGVGGSRSHRSEWGGQVAGRPPGGALWVRMAGLVALHIGGVLAGVGGGWLRWDGVARAGMVLWAVTAAVIGWIVLFSRRRP